MLIVYNDNFIYQDKSRLIFTCSNNNLKLEIYIIVIHNYHIFVTNK